MPAPGMFSEGVRTMILTSRDQAFSMGHHMVAPEHMLLAMTMNTEDMVGKVLVTSGLDANKIKEKIIIANGQRDPLPSTSDTEVDMSSRAKMVLSNAVVEAQQLQSSYVGVEHVLMAMLRDEKSTSTMIMREMGIDPSDVARNIARSMQRTQSVSTSSTPKLDRFSFDITAKAKKGELDPVIGRNQEVERIIQILSRRTKNNPVLIGPPGVGKTAIIEGLAQRILEGSVPDMVMNKRVVALDMARLVGGSKFRGEFEERMTDVVSEVIAAKNIILFIDEMHTLVGAGGSEGALDAANILKPALARGELQCVGATTIDEYRKYIEKDAALERRFQPVTVNEPTEEEAIEILKGLRDKYEIHHKTKITEEAVEQAVKLAVRYINDRYLPDKAIDLMDEACSRVRMYALPYPPELREAEQELQKIVAEKDEAINHQNFEKAAQLRDAEAECSKKVETMSSAYKSQKAGVEKTVTGEIVAEVLSAWMNIPVKQITEEESARLLHLEEDLHKRVIGQNEAIAAISEAIRRNRAGLNDPKRPIGSFLFLGPTGVGKTELAKALAESMFGDETSMIRLDMSEYQERHTVSKLIGSPPGYVGYDDGGHLTEKVRRRPYSVVLFDEIEKAHPDVFNIMLQIMDDGRLTDSKGRTVDFKNTLVIMTSNVGARDAAKSVNLGFAPARDQVFEYERLKAAMMDSLKQNFKPEFINRIDDIIVFHNLSQEDTKKIAQLMINQVVKRLKEKGMQLEVSDQVRDHLAACGFDPTYGARPLRRTIQKLMENRLADEVLKGTIHLGDTVEVNLAEDKLTFATKQ